MLIPANKILREISRATYHLRHNWPFIYTRAHARDTRQQTRCLTSCQVARTTKMLPRSISRFELSRSRETRMNLISYISHSFLLFAAKICVLSITKLIYVPDWNVPHYQPRVNISSDPSYQLLPLIIYSRRETTQYCVSQVVL